MFATENYYPEDLLSEDLLTEDFTDSLNYESDESSRWRNRPIRGTVRPRVAQSSNFGGTLQGRSADYVTKNELKTSLDNISKEVNELKKTSIDTNKTLTALDKKHTELAKIDAKKNENQTAVLRNMQMTNMIGTLLNKPTIDVNNLQANKDTGAITEKVAGASIKVDMMMSLLLPFMTTQSGGGSGDMNIMLPMILLLGQNKTGTSSTDSTLPLVMMMMMGQGKK